MKSFLRQRRIRLSDNGVSRGVASAAHCSITILCWRQTQLKLQCHLCRSSCGGSWLWTRGACRGGTQQKLLGSRRPGRQPPAPRASAANSPTPPDVAGCLIWCRSGLWLMRHIPAKRPTVQCSIGATNFTRGNYVAQELAYLAQWKVRLSNNSRCSCG